MKSGLVFAGMGFQLVGLILAAVYIGGIIDKSLNSGGLGIAIMIIAVLIGWFVHLLFLLKKFMKDEDDEGKNTNDSPN